MARIFVAGGGFGGVVAAEALAKRVQGHHEITLLSREREFVFYPALVRLAFGKCRLTDVSFDLPAAMRERGVDFLQAEIAHPDPERQQLVVRSEDSEKSLAYDYCVLAIGRRLAVANVPGLHQYAHHVLSVNAAQRFGDAIQRFHKGQAVIGWCRNARLTVPAFETAFALDRRLKACGERQQVEITLLCPENIGEQVGGPDAIAALQEALDAHGIILKPYFPVSSITRNEVIAEDGERMAYDLLRLIPPFRGPDEAMYAGITDHENFIRVNTLMQVTSAEHLYAVGDCVNLPGPKLGHMAVLQGEIAAANLVAELNGYSPSTRYDHDLLLVIDEGGEDSLFIQKELWERHRAHVSQGLFWSWAKEVNRRHWQKMHS
jgi:sulfide:quinone oxidoreductase